MKINFSAGILTLILFVNLTPDSTAQNCKFFGQKMCVRYLDDYLSNGQNNSASMASGETTQIQMIFYKGHDYRMVFCSEEHLGELGIKIKTIEGEVLFDNADHDMAFHWDFSMKKTQRFLIDVTAPGSGGGGGSEGEEGGEGAADAMEGCVSIALGVKPSVAKGFNKGQ